MSKRLAAGLALSLALSGTSAWAVPISFTSNGQFATNTNSDGNVTIVGNGNQVDWPGPGSSHSDMSADDLNKNQTSTTTGTHLLIGQIDWYNAVQSNTTSAVTFNYQLTLTFTTPSPGGAATQVIDLTVNNTPDHTYFCGPFVTCYTADSADTAGTFTLPSFTVDGLLVSNISFAVDGKFDPGSYSNGVWTNPETDTSTLDIYADISQVAVPEPGSIALLGAGLAGVGLIRRKRSQP